MSSRYIIERHWFAEPIDGDANPQHKVVAEAPSLLIGMNWLRAANPSHDDGEVMRLYIEHQNDDGPDPAWEREDRFFEWDGESVVEY